MISNGVAKYGSMTANPPFRMYAGAPARNQSQVEKLLGNYWKTHSGQDQFDLDAMMWTGAYTAPGDGSIQLFLQKLFSVLYYSGVFYNASKKDGVHDWRDAAKSLTLASLLSHGGRVIIQLPVQTGDYDTATDFFQWLTADVVATGRLITRTAATHALAEQAPAKLLPVGRKMRLAEQRGPGTGIRAAWHSKVKGVYKHYGVNVALGGAGNRNPWTDNLIQPDGAHGHVYIYFNPKEPGQCAGLMIGCENSAPHVVSQGYTPHDIRALSEEFSPCGTQKWPKMLLGPKPKKEAMFVDLSDGWQWLLGKVSQFDVSLLDQMPMPVPGGLRENDERRQLIYALMDVLADPTFAPHKAFFQQQMDTLLASQPNTATLDAIATQIERIATRNGAGASLGPRGRRGAVMMPLPLHNLSMAVQNAR